MPLGDAYTLTKPASGIELPECCAIPETREKSSWGGRRPGAGRPRKAPAPLYATDAPQWRVFATFGQAEISAARELARQGYETYLPLIAIRRRDAVIKSQWHEVRVPLFPSYGFIRLTQHESREPIAATRGVRELLHRPDGRLSLVADRIVDRLRDGEEARLRLPKEHGSVLAVGDVVTIGDGPFTGFPAVVEECDGVRSKVQAEVFGRMTSIWIDRIALELVA